MGPKADPDSITANQIDFSCETEDLIYGMDVVKRTLGSGKNMPILAGVRMKASEDEMELSSTDLEKSTTCHIPIENTENPATLILKGDVLAQITQRLPESGTVRFRSMPDENQKIEVSCGEMTFDLFQLPREDYPSIPEVPDEPLCEVDKEAFREGLRHTTFAALKSKEATRLSLTGVNTIFEGESLKLVATNGYRMALKTIPLERQCDSGPFLIEASALADWDRILSSVSGDEVKIYSKDSEIIFSAGSIVFTDKLIMEEFPEFEGVIPKDNDIPLRVDRTRFMETLRRAQITADEESGAVVLATTEGGDELKISSSSPEKGEFRETISLSEKAKTEIGISFKGQFLIDALRRMNGDQLTLWLSDSETAGLIEPAEEESDFIYVCMPISQQQ